MSDGFAADSSAGGGAAPVARAGGARVGFARGSGRCGGGVGRGLCLAAPGFYVARVWGVAGRGPERAAADELVREAERTGGRDTKDVAEEMAGLLKQLDDEQLTRKQVFEKLAELENRIKPSTDGNFDELKEKLRKAGLELSREKL